MGLEQAGPGPEAPRRHHREDRREVSRGADAADGLADERHGLAAMRVAEALRQALTAGQTMADVGIATSIGVRVPDVAWCSAQYLASHPEDMPLTSAPEICVDIASVSNALPKLREKARAYVNVNAGVIEAWLICVHDRRIEIHDRDGRREASSFPADLTAVFQS
ncbi:MAG: Uma2 family endonuclease [Gammaproteobacteria bacterium]